VLGYILYRGFDTYLPKPFFSYFKDVLVLFIIVYENVYAQRKIYLINFPLLILTLIGKAFIMMHWPYGFILYTASILTVLFLLAFDAIKSKIDAKLRIVILLFPLTRLVFQNAAARHFEIPWWPFGLLIVGFISVCLAVKLKRSA
jgi:hypothetical protein